MKSKLSKATDTFDVVASLTSPTYAVLCITDRLIRRNKRNAKSNAREVCTNTRSLYTYSVG